MSDEQKGAPENSEEETRTKLNRETARIGWHELEKHFAAGNVVYVSPELDLIEVAYQVSQDNKAAVEVWVAAEQVGAASDEQAAQWHVANTELWAVVVAPLVLVQPIK